MLSYWCEQAWLPPGRVARRVRLDVADGAVAAIAEDVEPGDARRLAGLVLPGFANAHSHAFHRALRGRTSVGRGDFWTWRQQMYAVAERLDPDSYLRLATAVYAEMALAGITCVGEFHYLHHGPGGTPYDDPNVMQAALADAAAAAGIRITLIDTCYLTGGIGRPLEGAQLRFGDGDADRWAARELARTAGRHVRFGAAVHSVRAVPADQIATVAESAQARDNRLHVHLSEQPAENDACRAAYGCTPTELLAKARALGPSMVAIHATHLTDLDVRLLGFHHVEVCFCPTTERDLADGIGPARQLADAGCRLSLGSDSHAIIDPFEEMRALEMHERLASGERGRFDVPALIQVASRMGHRALGWPEAGRIALGTPADLVAVGLDSPRTAGGDDPAATAVFAATAADVTDVVVGGRPVVREGVHLRVPDVG
ncbi:MAG: formimidoylglutamate deiminase, partial [Geodermatophilaceae bacterium]|nr:formimidoylglutamate deiminase [Geodermatophilaceae bacterium]